MLRFVAILLVLVATTRPVLAETLMAARTIRSKSILSAADLVVEDSRIPGALTNPEDAIGMEARVVLYAGRPIRPEDIGPPAIIERNQIITLVYLRGTLRISAEARSLGRAGVGDRLRVMNLASRNTVTGVVNADGTVTVGN